MNDQSLPIAIGSDHAGFKLKSRIRKFLEEKGFKVTDFGTHSEESVDYPDFVHPLARSVVHGKHDTGILICGSANGVAITANKYPEIRAAICWTRELAELARAHNNANILCIPARFVEDLAAEQITEAFLDSKFEGGRHQRRVEKIKIDPSC